MYRSRQKKIAPLLLAVGRSSATVEPFSPVRPNICWFHSPRAEANNVFCKFSCSSLCYFKRHARVVRSTYALRMAAIQHCRGRLVCPGTIVAWSESSFYRSGQFLCTVSYIYSSWRLPYEGRLAVFPVVPSLPSGWLPALHHCKNITQKLNIAR
jgi:hypothetical protein